MRSSDELDGGRVFATIKRRRSVRSGFTDERPATELLERIAHAGLLAPSSKNAQPWRLHVVTGRQLLDAVAETVKAQHGVDDFVPVDPSSGRPHERYRSTVIESAEVLKQVPAAIFVENLGEFSDGSRGLLAASGPNLHLALVGYGLEFLGLGAAVQNMWLAATEAGLGAAFLGDILIAEEHIRELLAMQRDLVGALALGYCGVAATPASSRAIDEGRIVHHLDS